MGVTRKHRGRDLTNKQKAFVDEYIVDLNAAHAAARAGYSKRTAGKIGAKLLTLPHVAAAVAAAMQARQERTQITADRVLEELARIAFGDPRKVMSWGPDGVTLIDSSELSDDEAAMIAEVSETKTLHGGSIKGKTHDKVRALELIGRHLKMFTDKVEHSGSVESLVRVYLPDNGRG